MDAPTPLSAVPLHRVLDAAFAELVIVRAVRDEAGRLTDFVVESANALSRPAHLADEQSVTGQSFRVLFPALRDPALWEQCCAVAITRQPVERTAPSPTAAQPDRMVRRRLSPLDPDLIVIASLDVTAQEQARAALEQSESRQRAQFEGSPAMQWLVDAETGRLLDVNPAAAAFYGWPRATMRAMYIEDFVVSASETATDGPRAESAERRVHTHRVASGAQCVVHVWPHAITVDGRRVLHWILHEASAGVMPSTSTTGAASPEIVASPALSAPVVGGIAHDFNNLLTVIRGSSGFVRDALGDASELLPDLDAIDRATQRAEALTRRLLTASRGADHRTPPTGALAIPAATAPTAPAAMSADGAAILVVDDDPMLLSLASRMLENAGQRVVTAESGGQALSLLASQRPGIGVVLTDLTMPAMSGMELIAAVTTRYPGLPVVAMSGFRITPATRAELDAHRVPFVPKPFTGDDLTAALARALPAPV